MIATHQVIPCKPELFFKVTMKHFKDLLEDTTLPLVTASVDKINQTAVIEGKETCGWIFRLTVVAYDPAKVKQSFTDHELRASVIMDLHQRHVRQRDIALLFGITQPLVSKIINTKSLSFTKLKRK